MKNKQIGSTDIQASVVGLGTWAIGGKHWGGTNKQDAINAIHCAINSGINLFDTAPIYGYGAAEEILGEALLKKRHQVVISSKCGLRWDSTEGVHSITLEGKSIYHNLKKASIKLEFENSLKRLNTDYIDIYHTHYPDPSTPLAETMEALLELKKDGKIRVIACSNIDLDTLKQYQELDDINVLQAEYNLCNRQIESAILPFCETHNISLFAYSPLAQGLLAGKLIPDHRFASGDMRNRMRSFSRKNISKAITVSQLLIPLLQKYQASQSQLILAWTLAQKGITHVLCGMRHEKQVKENFMSDQLSITNIDLLTISKIVHNAELMFGLHR